MENFRPQMLWLFAKYTWKRRVGKFSNDQKTDATVCFLTWCEMKNNELMRTRGCCQCRLSLAGGDRSGSGGTAATAAGV